MTDQTVSQNIKRCLQALAGVCDYAHEQDGVGFNGFDADFGHQLAEQTYPLTEGQEKAAVKLLKKYRRQLEGHGLVVPTIEEYETETPKQQEKARISITLKNQLIFIQFPGRPSPADLAVVKTLPDRRWNPDVDGKPWTVPAKFAPQVMEAYKENPNADIDPKLAKFAQVAPTATAGERIDFENGTIYVHFNGRPTETQLTAVRCLPERKWNPDVDGKPWSSPGRLATEVAQAFPDFAHTQKFQTHLETMNKLHGMSRQADSDFDVEMKGGKLLPFQRAGVEFLELANGRAIVGDEMGLGKTIQALAYLQLHQDFRPAVLVVPSSLKINWKREANKWLDTNDTIEILNGRKPYQTTGSILIINYDILTGWVKYLTELEPKIFIADEAHYMKNTKSQRSKAGKKLAKSIKQTLLLTGTPLTNRPAELFPLLQMIDPKAWPNFMRYAQDYCGAYHNGFGWDFGGATNLEELHEKIKPYMVRRVKSDVMKELPEKRRTTVVIEFDEKVRKEYEQAMIDAQLALSRQGNQAEHLTMIEKAKQCAVKGKLAYAIKWIENFLDVNGKLVVFCTHNFTVDTLMETFGDRAVKVTGAVTGDARQAAVDAFQDDENIRLFVGNIKAAGVGLTLTAASDVAFLEFAWTPGDHVQSEDRCHRIGQENSVTAWYLVADNTIDEEIANLIQDKAKNIHAVLDGTAVDFSYGILNELASAILKYKENGK